MEEMTTSNNVLIGIMGIIVIIERREINREKEVACLNRYPFSAIYILAPVLSGRNYSAGKSRKIAKFGCRRQWFLALLPLK